MKVVNINGVAHNLPDDHASLLGILSSLGQSQVLKATPVNAVAATLALGVVGNNNSLTFTAKESGAPGNSITITYVDPGGVSATLGIVVTGNNIVVNLGRASSAINTTAADIITAIQGNAQSNALVSVANTSGSSGAGLVTAEANTALSGGVSGTVAPPGQLAYDSTYLYVAIAGNGISDANWRRISVGSVF